MYTLTYLFRCHRSTRDIGRSEKKSQSTGREIQEKDGGKRNRKFEI